MSQDAVPGDTPIHQRVVHIDEATYVPVGNCSAHARREFYDIRASYPQDTLRILDLIDEVLAIEHKVRTWDELEALRRTESAASASRVRDWLLAAKRLPSSGLVKATDYCPGAVERTHGVF